MLTSQYSQNSHVGHWVRNTKKVDLLELHHQNSNAVGFIWGNKIFSMMTDDAAPSRPHSHLTHFFALLNLEKQ